MKHQKEGVLKIYASTTDTIHHSLLYEYIVKLAKKEGISGVTVYRGVMGYGLSSDISTSKFWELTEKLPVVIELIDSKKKLKNFYKLIEQELRDMPKGCLVTLESIKIRLQKRGNKH